MKVCEVKKTHTYKSVCRILHSDKKKKEMKSALPCHLQ